MVKECLGVPYVHGGRDLIGFDCLGLVWYLYNRLGINIPDRDGELYPRNGTSKNLTCLELNQTTWRSSESGKSIESFEPIIF